MKRFLAWYKLQTEQIRLLLPLFPLSFALCLIVAKINELVRSRILDLIAGTLFVATAFTMIGLAANLEFLRFRKKDE